MGYSLIQIDLLSNALFWNMIITQYVAGALEKYYEVNGAMPQKIVLYRDGVGDGQLYTVYKSEFEQIMSAFAEVGVSNSRYVAV